MNKKIIDDIVWWIPIKNLRNELRKLLYTYDCTEQEIKLIDSSCNELKEEIKYIKYGVVNSDIITIHWHYRFKYKMYQYMIDNRDEFRENIEDFKIGLDEDSINYLNSWIIQIKSYACNGATFYRIPNDTSFFTDEQKIVWSSRDNIYSTLIDKYKVKYNIRDIGLTIHTHYYHCGIIHLPTKVKERFKNSIAIDGGAYICDTAIMFAEEYNFKTILSFEPSKKSFDICSDTINKYNLSKKIKLYRYALSNTNDKINIIGDNSDAFTSNDKNEGGEIIDSIMLDDFLNRDENIISLIKLDIEGFEEQALLGAEQIIKKHKPVLLISCYHDHTALGQMFRLKKYVENLNLSYKILFRCLDIDSTLEYNLICYTE